MGNFNSRSNEYKKDVKDIKNDNVYDTMDNEISEIKNNEPVANINKSLVKFKRFVELDIRNPVMKQNCLNLLKEDLNKEMSYQEFINKYETFYPYLGQLGKTSYEICKTDLNLNKTNYLLNRNKSLFYQI